MQKNVARLSKTIKKRSYGSDIGSILMKSNFLKFVFIDDNRSINIFFTNLFITRFFYKSSFILIKFSFLNKRIKFV